MPHSTFCAWLFTWGIAVSAGSFADEMSKSDYATAEDRISAEHEAADAECNKMVDNSTDARALQSNDKDSLEMAERAFHGSTNAKEICVATADGKQKVAMAELEYRRSPSDENRIKVDTARADAAIAIAKLNCADQAVEAQKPCIEDAQAKSASSE
jgi:hypothetical protein